ncbi:hypothetical protein BO82DRAFT_422657 [Aspergillus uvarum CBS 121591]|uniref:Uncharacterized protein n=1 Tax=Aspergillus uvarum CBS 121591 TaxID=1448315 RepID=A0A319CMF5_9EURO|nr:hypothetical protein BO82DRAFT_422657 [Aspergillus uvarum CBS 121591]PYH85740.1 hypothetical protein BO82DRAFT_422657 [Aspergillus uvarum CBS 121591]
MQRLTPRAVGQVGVLAPEPAEVKKYIHNLSSTGETPADELCKAPFDSNKPVSTRMSYMSFGDEEATATVTRFGEFTQISRYLGHKPSSIYAIGSAGLPAAHRTRERAQHLEEMIEWGYGFGPGFQYPRAMDKIETYWWTNARSPMGLQSSNLLWRTCKTHHFPSRKYRVPN